jgi:hypothetical protein
VLKPKGMIPSELTGAAIVYFCVLKIILKKYIGLDYLGS